MTSSFKYNYNTYYYYYCYYKHHHHHDYYHLLRKLKCLPVYQLKVNGYGQKNNYFLVALHFYEQELAS